MQPLHKAYKTSTLQPLASSLSPVERAFLRGSQRINPCLGIAYENQWNYSSVFYLSAVSLLNLSPERNIDHYVTPCRTYVCSVYLFSLGVDSIVYCLTMS